MKLALVTGARRGIGLAIARALGLEGYHVLLCAASEDAAPVLDQLRGEGIACEYARCDISSADDRQALLTQIARDYGRLDLLVNNAGVAPLARLDLLQTTEESLRRVLDINLLGTFFMCQQAANFMVGLQGTVKEYRPRIINISSISAYTSSTSRGEYCISKAGVSMVTQLFADRLAEHGIPVFEVRPGIILTEMTAPVREKYQKLIDEGLTPVKRFGQPEDVADCVLTLCSGRLDFATGQVLNADGGFHIRRL